MLLMCTTRGGGQSLLKGGREVEQKFKQKEQNKIFISLKL